MMQGEVGDPLVESVRDWVAGWGREVATLAFASARARFRDDVVAFGTRADIVSGLDALHDQQWSHVWPTIEDFRFVVADLVVLPSPDARQVVAICPWTSTGVAADGTRFDRPGRATIVLQRDSPEDAWRGAHTHFSLTPGGPGAAPATHPPAG
jgi:ketosteroid isomerase-like protein